MKLARRTFVYLARGAAVLPLVPRNASGQIYPTRPVRLICAFPAGGPNDTLARLIGQWLSERLGRPFVVENRPGAATNIATEAVVRAPPDGYTLLLVAQVNAINVTLYERLNFNFIRDIAAVAGIMRVPSILEVNPSVPVHTVPEFIAYAKANPGRLNMASAGNGTSSHLSGELFKIMTGVDILHVPYRGAAAALTDLIAARVQVYFDLMPNSIAHVRSGKVRPLAITTTTRSGALPDLPSVGDFVPGYEVNTWFGVGAPRGTPADIVDKLNEEINAALADPQMKARLAELGGTVLAGTPADFEKLIGDETEKWARVIRAANIKPD
ncbi:MAG: tripartite tricarboxylate transporter substrate binding protein [Xanthobacteraceae bacterium]